MSAWLPMETAHKIASTLWVAITVLAILDFILLLITGLAMVGINKFKSRVIMSLSLFLDINECLTRNGDCSQICTNANGSYFCSCNSGYQLSSNGLTCNGESIIEYK